MKLDYLNLIKVMLMAYQTIGTVGYDSKNSANIRTNPNAPGLDKLLAKLLPNLGSNIQISSSYSSPPKDKGGIYVPGIGPVKGPGNGNGEHDDDDDDPRDIGGKLPDPAKFPHIPPRVPEGPPLRI